MGKKRDKDQDETIFKKKSKKHKKHKKKKSHTSLSDYDEIDVVNDDTGTSQDEGRGSFKLKIKFGGKTLSTAEVVSESTAAEEDEIENENIDLVNLSNDEEENVQMEDNEVENEEEEWLEALEKGELDDTGGLKKEKNTALMTARQRALHGETNDEGNSLLQLPMYPERTEEENEEFERKRQVRAKKRRQQMQKQIEETKTQTIEKLLTKGQKAKKDPSKQSQKDNIQHHIRYCNSATGVTISYPHDLDYPLQKNQLSRTSPASPIIVKCTVKECENVKKYACSKTKLPICSLECYKIVNANIGNIQQVT